MPLVHGIPLHTHINTYTIYEEGRMQWNGLCFFRSEKTIDKKKAILRLTYCVLMLDIHFIFYSSFFIFSHFIIVLFVTFFYYIIRLLRLVFPSTFISTSFNFDLYVSPFHRNIRSVWWVPVAVLRNHRMRMKRKNKRTRTLLYNVIIWLSYHIVSLAFTNIRMFVYILFLSQCNAHFHERWYRIKWMKWEKNYRHSIKTPKEE